MQVKIFSLLQIKSNTKINLTLKMTCHVLSLRLHPIFDCFQLSKDKYRIKILLSFLILPVILYHLHVYLAKIKFNLAQMKFNLAHMKINLAQMKINVAQMKFNLAQMKINLAEMKFKLTSMKLYPVSYLLFLYFDIILKNFLF